MMFSLITQRLVARLPIATPSLTYLVRAGVLLPSTLQAQTRLNRRTFLTGSPRLAFPAAAKKSTTVKKSTSTTKPAAKKPAAKKTATTKAKAKPKKKVVAKKKKPVVKKKPKPKKPIRLKITRDDLPPRQPHNAYVFYFTESLKNVAPEGKRSPADVIKHSKEIGSQWSTLSDAEKQPYRDQAAKARVTYEAKREQYWKTVDSATVNEINRRRRAKGKSIVRRHTKPEDKRPIGSYLRYLKDFRATPEGQSIMSAQGLISLAKAASVGWAKLSKSEKAPYVESAKEDMQAWKVKHSKA